MSSSSRQSEDGLEESKRKVSFEFSSVSHSILDFSLARTFAQVYVLRENIKKNFNILKSKTPTKLLLV